MPSVASVQGTSLQSPVSRVASVGVARRRPADPPTAISTCVKFLFEKDNASAGVWGRSAACRPSCSPVLASGAGALDFSRS